MQTNETQAGKVKGQLIAEEPSDHHSLRSLQLDIATVLLFIAVMVFGIAVIGFCVTNKFGGGVPTICIVAAPDNDGDRSMGAGVHAAMDYFYAGHAKSKIVPPRTLLFHYAESQDCGKVNKFFGGDDQDSALDLSFKRFLTQNAISPFRTATGYAPAIYFLG